MLGRPGRNPASAPGLGPKRKDSWTMNFVAAAEPEIDKPRDAPNAPADRQALGLVRPYQGMVAWPTVFLAIGVIAGFALVTTLATLDIIPLWLGLVLNTF